MSRLTYIATQDETPTPVPDFPPFVQDPISTFCLSVTPDYISPRSFWVLAVLSVTILIIYRYFTAKKEC